MKKKSTPKRTPRHTATRNITVRPVYRAEPDLHKLALAFILLAEDQHAREAAAQRPEQSDAA